MAVKDNTSRVLDNDSLECEIRTAVHSDTDFRGQVKSAKLHISICKAGVS
jgi:hypothetical protein